MTEYWADFVRESRDRITELNNALLTLERNPDDSEAMEEVFRIAHTLKGNCGAAGLEGASELAHAIEDLLDAVRAGRLEVSPELMDDIFDAVDDLETMVERVADHQERGEVDVTALQTAPSASIQSLRSHLEGPAPIDVPTDEEIEEVLSRFEQPAGDQNVYLVRISVAESEVEGENAGILVVKALIDAFDLIGTAPPRHAIEAHAYNGRFDAVFASAVTKAAIASGLEPVDEVADFELVDVTEQFDDIAAMDTDESESSLSDPDISADEAKDLEVDELLGEFDQYDDLDNLVEEVEDDDDLDAFDNMGKAGSFEDLLGDDDVEIEFDEANDVDADADSAADADVTPADTQAATDSSAASEASDTGAAADEDSETVDDAEAVFQELKDEVEMVGFDELQEELDELEFDEFDTDDEVGMDELLGDDLETDSDETFLGEPPADSDTVETDESDAALEDDLEDLVTGDESADEGDPVPDNNDADADDSATDVGTAGTGLETAPDADAETDGQDESEQSDVSDDVEHGDDSLEEDVDRESIEDEPSAEEDDTTDVDEDGFGDDPSVSEFTETSDEDTAAVVEQEDDTVSEEIDEDDSDESDADDDFATGGFEPATDSLEPVTTDTDDKVDTDNNIVDFSKFGSEIGATVADEGGLEAGDTETADASAADEAGDPEAADASTANETGDETAFGDGKTHDDSLETDDEWTTPDADSVDSFTDADTLDESAFTDDDLSDSFETTVDTDAAAFDQDLESGVESELDDDRFDDAADEFETPDDDTAAFEAVSDTSDAEAFEIDDDASFDALEASTNATVETDFNESDAVSVDTEASLDDTADSLESLEDTLDTDDAESFEDTFGDDAFGELEDGKFDIADTFEADDSEGFGDDAADRDGDRSDTAADDKAVEPEIRIDEPSLEIPDIDLPDDSRVRETDDGPDEMQSVHVDVEQIDELLTLVEGLVTSRVRLRHAVDADEDRQALESELDALEDLTGELQETVMDVRLVPLGTVTNRLPRVVRDISREQDKTVSFEITGEDVELDRTILDRISDPLMHLVRNAVDHGIEAPDERADTDKPEAGSVEVTATRTRDRVELTVEDDGSGLDPDRLRSEAIDAGVIGEDDAEAMSDEQVYDLVFHPGLSTADEVTDVSGRGVGMDVVKRTVTELDGSVSVDSTPGDGTTVTMMLPVSIAIDDVLFLEIAGQEFGIPIDVVHDVESATLIETADGKPVLPVSNEPDDGVGAGSGATAVQSTVSAGAEESGSGHAGSVPVVSLTDVLETKAETETDAEPAADGDTKSGVVVRIRDDVRQVAFQCDHVYGQQEVVVKPFEGFMSGIPGLSGATVRGRGEIVNILDVTTL
ncbi:chemotaxis protein CheA [Natronolimnobius sp. AArcel1]|uniref:chemotaxis protein CheA n=1 Tax=Natronolimnobius sp. AArcel1 TaxID=1679093 RepID=UPI0013EA73D3|nr:chemotaxis protein CheA [Natronolimnobius sp. AArcel1]NGM67527.1 chemotaxis protein CheA [Natronolimnobius sp. AArcel1]